MHSSSHHSTPIAPQITLLAALAALLPLALALLGWLFGYSEGFVAESGIPLLSPIALGAALGGLIWFSTHPDQEPGYLTLALWPLIGSAILNTMTHYFLSALISLESFNFLATLYIPAIALLFTIPFALVGPLAYYTLRKIPSWISSAILAAASIITLIYSFFITGSDIIPEGRILTFNAARNFPFLGLAAIFFIVFLRRVIFPTTEEG